MPTVLRASLTGAPAGALIFLPSTVRFTSAIRVVPASRRLSPGRARPGTHPQTKNPRAFARNRGGETPALHEYWLRRALVLERAGPSFQMIFKFLAELFHEGDHRHRGRITQRTECSSQHVFRQILHVVDVFLHAPTRMEPNQRFLQPVCSLAAGNAPSATFVLVKFHRAEREFHDALRVVDDHHAA